MASKQYAYTKARMTFADPQFREWETDDKNLRILNFKNITIIGANNIVYIFKHLVEENNRHRTLVLAWQGSNDDIWLSLINQTIKICFEDPDHQNAFIICDTRWQLMLLHNDSEIIYYKSNFANLRHLVYIQHIHSNILIGIFQENYTTVWWREIIIRPWNKHGNLIKDAYGKQITTIMRESKHISINNSHTTKFIYSHNTNEIICHCRNYATTYITIYRININTLEYSTQKINIEPYSFIYAIDIESGQVIFIDEYNQLYVKDPATKIRKNVNGTTYYGFIHGINSTTFISQIATSPKESITFRVMYYDQGAQKLDKLFDTYHKVYSADTNIMISGLTIYHRVPIQVIETLPSIVSYCPSHCCEMIAKFLRANPNIIIPAQVKEQS